MSNASEPNTPSSNPWHFRAERAGYIAKMSTELARMADAANFALLSYLLRMAAEEAGHVQELQADLQLSSEEARTLETEGRTVRRSKLDG